MKTLLKKVKLLILSNFTFSHNVFYAICILKSFNSHISVVVCSLFEFGTVSKSVLQNRLTLSKTSPGFYVSAVQVFWKHCGKRRNCSYWAISPFPTVFYTHLDDFLLFSSNLELSSANSFRLEGSKIYHLGKWNCKR